MSIEVHIVDGPLDVGAATWKVPGAGAILSFDGVVRPHEDGRPIVGLHYQTYDPMASNVLRQLAQEAHRRFGVLSIHVAHSRGDVPVGRCSFRLQVATAHRAEALAAMSWFIDSLKQDVPIWKSALPMVKQ